MHRRHGGWKHDAQDEAVIVYAVDEVSAMREGRRVLSGLCGDGKDFDWIRTFDDPDAAQMQG